MRFQKPPEISRRAIDRAGDTLISNTASQNELSEARETLNKWRACHAYPINTFQATLRRKIRSGNFGKNSIIAQRLKRGPTIIAKLREGRDHDIRLLNMQDIAGVRAILSSIKEVRKLEKEYRDTKRFVHLLHTRSKDYINEPKKKDGYRSIHLIYKYKNKKHPDWDDLWIELQIRTRLQHSWATAVETLHTFLGKAIKTRQGQKSDAKWTDFFRLVSAAFAHIEGTPIVSVYKSMSRKEVHRAIQDLEKELNVIDKLEAFPFAFKIITKKTNGHFHLIILNTKEKNVSVKPFGRDDFEKATKEYDRVERESVDKPEIEAVLVSATEVQEAYPSFFANTKDFKAHLRYVLSGDWLE